MKILFASKNPAKINYYAGALKEMGIDVLTLKDIDMDIEIKEDGNSAIENAIQKAKPYYEATKITTIGIDDNLYIDGLDSKEQPGTHVRRINGERLSDEEALNYYIDIIKKLGGKAEARWVKGIAICKDGEIKTFESTKNKFYFVTKRSEIIHEGYPLDSISIIPEFNKYLTELSEEEKRIYKSKSSVQEVLEFIKNNI